MVTNTLLIRLRHGDRGSKRRKPRPWTTAIGCVIVGAFILLAFFGGLLTVHDPLKITGEPLQPPSGNHWLGTDDIGRDVWSYTVHGSGVYLQIGFSVAVITLALGILVGTIAGYVGGVIDGILLKITEFFQVIPGFVLALVIVAILGQNTWFTIIALSLTMWPATARIVRSQFLALKQQEFVEAARSQGFGGAFIAVRDVLPNALPPAVVQTLLDVGTSILLAAGLAYLGLGDPNRPDWGLMLNRSQQYLEQAPWMSLAPGLAIFLVVIGINLLDDLVNNLMNGTIGRRK